MSQPPFDNTNRGAIWGNKEKDDQHPNWCDYKGSINIEGVEYWLSGWKRKKGDPDNRPAMSFTVKAKDEAHKQGVDNASQAAQGNSEPEFDDDIPF